MLPDTLQRPQGVSRSWPGQPCSLGPSLVGWSWGGGFGPVEFAKGKQLPGEATAFKLCPQLSEIPS